MKNSKKTFIVIEAVLAVLVLIVAFAMLQEKNGVEKWRIAVVVRNSDDNQWASFKYGLQMAAQDQQTGMLVVGTGDMLTVEEEEEAIRQAVRNGADAVIVQPVPEKDAGDMLQEIQKKVPVVLVEKLSGGKDESSGLPAVKADDFAMGERLAKELLKDYNGKLEGRTLGILCENEESGSVEDREEGFLSVMGRQKVRIAWKISNPAREEVQEYSVEKQEKADVVVALDDYSLIWAGKLAAANNLHGALVYGIGNSTEAVYYLDTGYAQCLVVPDQFDLGYQSMKETAESLGRVFKKPQNRTVSFTVLRRDNLFSEENQELLFTMSR